MSDHKNQHFVPRFLLKHFSISANEKSIGIYNLANRHYHLGASISGQASKPYFYSRDIDFEKLLSEKEAVLSSSIKTLLSDRRIDITVSEGNLEMYDLINIQRLRTESFFSDTCELIKDIINQDPTRNVHNKFTIDQLFKQYPYKTYLIEQFIYNALGTPILFDLSFRLLENLTATSFITSDNPVVVYNNYLYGCLRYTNEGLALKGVNIMLPLTPKYCLLLFDDKFTTCCHVCGLSRISNDEDVNEINSLQILNRPKTLFFNETIKQDYIEYLITINKHYSITLKDTYIRVNESDLMGHLYDKCTIYPNVKHKKEPRISIIQNQVNPFFKLSIEPYNWVRNPEHVEHVNRKRKELINNLKNNSSNNQ